jgi:hypothetical protein
MKKMIDILPDPVTDPTTGYYLLTPDTWNAQQERALYDITDGPTLLAKMAQAMSTTIDKLDKPERVFVIDFPNSAEIEMGHTGTTRFIITPEGWVHLVNRSVLAR